MKIRQSIVPVGRRQVRLGSPTEPNRGRTRVQCSACNVVKLRPPQKVPPPNPILEDESDNEPRRIVDAGGWGDKSDAVQDDWGANVFDPRLGMPPLP